MNRKILISMIFLASLLSGCGSVEETDEAKAAAVSSAVTTAVTVKVTEKASDSPAQTTSELTELNQNAPEDNISRDTRKREETSATETEKVTQADSGRKMTPPAEGEAVTDIRLWSDKRELDAEKDFEIIWYAEIPPECDPETVTLFNADTNEPLAELNDIADYEKYGGDIMGDGVYNCRYTVRTELDLSDDVSDQVTLRYYAAFTDEHGSHRSEPAEITVYEPFTEKEFEDMEAVYNAVHALMTDSEYLKLDTDGRREKMVSLLKRLAEEGTPERHYPLIIPESIHASDDMVSYKHCCGVGSGVKLTPFDKRKK